MSPLPLLQAEHVSITRNGVAILQDVSFKISAGDFITIVGPNGAGKSMLLKCLLGIVPPDSGQVERVARLRVGYMPQRVVLDQTLPIAVKRFLTLNKHIDRDALAKVIEETSISMLLDAPLYALSSGELQRVLLARALLDAPELLVLDEPAQNLDISGQLAFYKLLERIYAERKLAILMVSHDLHLVMSCTKQVVCLFHHVCCSGEPQVVTKDPEFTALFGNDMARLMAVYHHSHQHTHEHDAGCDHAPEVQDQHKILEA